MLLSACVKEQVIITEMVNDCDMPAPYRYTPDEVEWMIENSIPMLRWFDEYDLAYPKCLESAKSGGEK